MYHKAWDGNAWLPSPTGWEALGGTFDSAPAVASWGSDRLDIFGLGTDNSMYHKALTASPVPSAHRPGTSLDGVPSLFFHRSMAPPVPGVRVLDTARRLQPAYNTGVPKLL